MQFGKGVGTSPKVRGPVKFRSHLLQKLTYLRYISTQICALLVLVDRLPCQNCSEKRDRFKNNFGQKVSGPWPPWPLPFLRLCSSEIVQSISAVWYFDGRSGMIWRKLDYAARCAVDVLLRLQETGKEVVVLGPLPRPRHDLGGRWEGSPAFHLERRLRTVAPAGVKIMNLGRQLTKSKKKRNLVSTDVLPYFRNDRLHLSLAGYQRLAPHLPAWLRISGAETC